MTIYHGPYSAYTPISLQKKIQEGYDGQIPIYDRDILLKASVEKNEKLDYKESWLHTMIGKDKTYKNQLHLYSLNTVSWLFLKYMSGGIKISDGHDFEFIEGTNVDTGNSRTAVLKIIQDGVKNDTLEIIGYKRSDRMYYHPLVVWHKDSVLFRLDSLVETRKMFVLNNKRGSGSTNLVANVYLREKYKSVDVVYMSKSEMLQSLVSKNQLIGVMSDDEFTNQLDEGQKRLLFMEPMMINIPIDPIVVRKWEWDQVGVTKRKEVLARLKKEYILIDTIGRQGEIMDCLRDMLKFYLSMPIIDWGEQGERSVVCKTESSFIRGDSIFKGRDTVALDTIFDEKGLLYLCRVRYADIRNPFYSFELKTISRDGRDTEDEKKFNRLIPLESKAEFDALMIRYKELFNKSEVIW